MKLNENQVAD